MTELLVTLLKKEGYLLLYRVKFILNKRGNNSVLSFPFRTQQDTSGFFVDGRTYALDGTSYDFPQIGEALSAVKFTLFIN